MDKTLSVEEAKTRLIYELSITTGFKYLKSGVLKKTIRDIVFEINFFFSKWNVSGQSIEVMADLRLMSAIPRLLMKNFCFPNGNISTSRADSRRTISSLIRFANLLSPEK